MKLKELSIENYRNLNNQKIFFDSEKNFLVGDNGIGKSNFLDLLDSLFEKRFSEDDFQDINKEIIVDFSLELNNTEIGFFLDYFDPLDENKNVINISSKIGHDEDYMKYYHQETEEEIPKKMIQGINYIKYDASKNSPSELSFTNNKGIGKLFQFMVETKIPDNVPSIADRSDIKDIVRNINSSFEKLEILNNTGIKTKIEENTSELIKQILVMQDSQNHDIRKSGAGIQYSIFVIFKILDKLMKINNSNYKRENYILSNENDEKEISMILGLDEPEIHLHPYKQRNLINYVLKIINNKEENFKSLLNEFFGIDLINGQLITATHSPNILSGDYSNIIRFQPNEFKTDIISGYKIQLTDQLKKHLVIKGHYIKESFFSDFNILVEGDTEYTAFPIFANRLGIDIDKLGVSIIPVGSKQSIIPIHELLKKFRIKSVGVYDMDNDGFPSQFEEEKHGNYIFSTDQKNFEEEVYNNFEIAYLIKLLEKDSKDEKYFFKNPCFFMNKIRDTNINIDCTQPIFSQINELDENDQEIFKIKIKNLVCENFKDKKGIKFGQIMAENIDNIPSCYSNVLNIIKDENE